MTLLSNTYRFSQASRWFYLFLFVHLLCWSLVPALVRLNLPLDAIEGTIWGHQLEWGYDKNPYLNGWLTALATQLGDSGWGIYLFSQLSVTACLWAMWRLANCMLPPAESLLSVLALEGLQYFNFHAIDFNDNTLELGLWGLGSYYFYVALKKNDYTHWLLTGLCVGLGMMAKYYTATLLLAMALLLFSQSKYRRLLCTIPPYAGLAIFLTLCLPHIFWLFSHNFVTVHYVFARAASTPSWTNHLFFPTLFAWQQFQVLLPALILLGLFLVGKKPLRRQEKISLSFDDRQYLLFIGCGPLLLTLALSLLCGTNLRAGWGMPLLSMMGIITVSILQPQITPPKFHRFLALIFALMFTILTLYTFSLTASKDKSTANFPGREIATYITEEWHQRYHTPLEYVAGSRWVSGNIGFYSKDHPAVFIEWHPEHAPWINQQQMREKGAVFVWEISANEQLPDAVKQQFPELSTATVVQFNWQRNKSNLEPVRLGVAYLAPKSYV